MRIGLQNAKEASTKLAEFGFAELFSCSQPLGELLVGLLSDRSKIPDPNRLKAAEIQDLFSDLLEDWSAIHQVQKRFRCIRGDDDVGTFSRHQPIPQRAVLLVLEGDAGEKGTVEKALEDGWLASPPHRKTQYEMITFQDRIDCSFQVWLPILALVVPFMEHGVEIHIPEVEAYELGVRAGDAVAIAVQERGGKGVMAVVAIERDDLHQEVSGLSAPCWEHVVKNGVDGILVDLPIAGPVRGKEENVSV